MSAGAVFDTGTGRGGTADGLDVAGTDVDIIIGPEEDDSDDGHEAVTEPNVEGRVEFLGGGTDTPRPKICHESE